MQLKVLDGLYAVCRLEAGEQAPAWAQGKFSAIIRTEEELSIVCDQAAVPAGIRQERDWRVIKVEGPLDFSLIGILAALSGALAAAGISIFAVSTFDTDYILLKAEKLAAAQAALRASGYEF